MIYLTRMLFKVFGERGDFLEMQKMFFRGTASGNYFFFLKIREYLT
jgi:hypothetical protein